MKNPLEQFSLENQLNKKSKPILMEKNNEVKRTQGLWECGYGDSSKAFGIFTKNMLDEGLMESPICLISPIDKMDETDKANGEFICKAVNEYDKLKADNEQLLNTLGKVQTLVSFVINATPTGSTRNLLTDANIIALAAIKQSESK